MTTESAIERVREFVENLPEGVRWLETTKELGPNGAREFGVAVEFHSGWHVLVRGDCYGIMSAKVFPPSGRATPGDAAEFIGRLA
jgi:hypothetical protein